MATLSNEGRCTQCHPSYGWKSGTPDSFFDEVDNIDCLICHDTTGTYQKHPTADGGGGQPALMIDGELTAVEPADLTEIAFNVGAPGRANCLACHAKAGGGDNIKHGDLSTDLIEPTVQQDVHMGGQNYTCQQCHRESSHKIAGATTLYGDEGEVSCTDCHSATNPHTETAMVASLLNVPTHRVACRACHIPTFARTMATMVAWYWGEAGEDRTDIPEQHGQPTYNKKKGRFEWDMNVTPTYLWYNGQWDRMVVNANDTYEEAGTEADPVVLGQPTATIADTDAKIYPFKKMVGTQPADPTNNRLVVPHLFGTGPGPDPYWASFDWGLAIEEGTAYAGQPYSGDYAFVHTVMYLSVNHEVAPKEDALSCESCHGNAAFWNQVGMEDPFGT